MYWITCWTTNPGITRSIPRFSSLLDETLNGDQSLYDLIVGGTINLSSLTHLYYISLTVKFLRRGDNMTLWKKLSFFLQLFQLPLQKPST